MAGKGVVIPIIADVKGLTQGLGDTEKRLKRLGSNIGSVGSSLTKGLTLPIVGAGAAAIAFSADFNKGMANIATLIPENAERVDELKQGLMDLGPEVGKSLSDLTDGLYQTISAFGDTADSVKILEINARAATAGLATTTDAINLTSAVTKGYGDTSAEAVEQASDLALLTVRLGQTTFPELAASIGKVIPLASSLNVTQEELFATMATLTGVTGGAAEVSTQMRGALQALLAPTADAAKAMEEAGYASGQALIENLGFAGAIEFLTKAADDAGVPLQKYISSIEGQTIALALTGAQADEYQKKLAEMGKAQGVTNQAFDEATTGVGGAAFGFAQLRAQAEVMAVSLGDGLAPALKVVMDNVKPLMDRVVDLSRRFSKADKDTQRLVITILAVVAAIGPVLIIVGKMITIVGTAITVIKAMKVAFAALNATMLLNPIGLIVVAIAALIAGLVIAYKRSETFRNIVDLLGATVRDVLIRAFDWLRKKIAEIWPEIQKAYDKAKPILELIGKAVELYVTTYIRVVATVVRGWFAVFETAYKLLLPVVKLIGGIIKDYIVANVNGIKTAVNAGRDAFDGIRSAIVTLRDKIEKPVNRVSEFIRTGIGGAVNYVSGLIGGISTMWRATVQTIKDVWNRTIGGRGFSLPGWLGGNSFTIPKLAEGGIVTRPTIAMIGEAGPEAVVPLNRLASAGGRNGGGDIYLTVNAGLGTNPDELGRVIVDTIKRYERRNGQVFSGPLVPVTATARGVTTTSSGATDFNRLVQARRG